MHSNRVNYFNGLSKLTIKILITKILSSLFPALRFFIPNFPSLVKYLLILFCINCNKFYLSVLTLNFEIIKSLKPDYKLINFHETDYI